MLPHGFVLSGLEIGWEITWDGGSILCMNEREEWQEDTEAQVDPSLARGPVICTKGPIFTKWKGSWKVVKEVMHAEDSVSAQQEPATIMLAVRVLQNACLC